jgi:hypothetical protein
MLLAPAGTRGQKQKPVVKGNYLLGSIGSVAERPTERVARKGPRPL